jgi:hypothetical protein
MAKNITMINGGSAMTLGTTNPLKISPSNTVSQPTNWYYGYTKSQGNLITITINVSGWYSWLLTGPAGPGGANSDYGPGIGGGGGAGSATAQQVYFAAGTTLWVMLSPYSKTTSQVNVLMLTNNTTTNCEVNGLNYSIVLNSYGGVYNWEYNGSWYPANTAVQGTQGASAGNGYGGNGGSGGNNNFNTTGSDSIDPGLNTYSWYVFAYPLMYNGYPNVFQEDPQAFFPTSYGGAGGNGGVYDSSGQYNGQIGKTYPPATIGNNNGGENSGYVTFTCDDGMSVVINTAGVQHAGAVTGFFMFYYCSP